MVENNIDLGLSVLCAVNKNRVALSQTEIADVCGCNRSNIGYIESKARKKIATYCKERGLTLDLLIV